MTVNNLSQVHAKPDPIVTGLFGKKLPNKPLCFIFSYFGPHELHVGKVLNKTFKQYLDTYERFLPEQVRKTSELGRFLFSSRKLTLHLYNDQEKELLNQHWETYEFNDKLTASVTYSYIDSGPRFVNPVVYLCDGNQKRQVLPGTRIRDFFQLSNHSFAVAWDQYREPRQNIIFRIFRFSIESVIRDFEFEFPFEEESYLHRDIWNWNEYIFIQNREAIYSFDTREKNLLVRRIFENKCDIFAHNSKFFYDYTKKTGLLTAHEFDDTSSVIKKIWSVQCSPSRCIFANEKWVCLVEDTHTVKIFHATNGVLQMLMKTGEYRPNRGSLVGNFLLHSLKITYIPSQTTVDFSSTPDVPLNWQGLKFIGKELVLQHIAVSYVDGRHQYHVAYSQIKQGNVVQGSKIKQIPDDAKKNS